MKNVRLFLVFIIALFLSGCKKTYSCHCEVISIPSGGSTDFVIAARKKEDAKKKCSSYSTMLPNSVPPSYDTYCSLK